MAIRALPDGGLGAPLWRRLLGVALILLFRSKLFYGGLGALLWRWLPGGVLLLPLRCNAL